MRFMIIVIFEVTPKKNHIEKYFDLAAELKSKLITIDGFISVERFKSLTDQNKFLSLSFWRDQEAVEAWYREKNHVHAQKKGRSNIFEKYQIHVTETLYQYDMISGRPDTSILIQNA